MIFVLLSLSYVARAASRISSRALDSRALGVRDGDLPPLPAPMDDDLPRGDGKDLIPWSDDDYAGEDCAITTVVRPVAMMSFLPSSSKRLMIVLQIDCRQSGCKLAEV